MSSETGTKVLRVPSATHLEATQMAALRGQSAGQLVAEAWRDYMAHHREEFAEDLEKVAKLMRDGTLEQLAEFTSRNADTRAAEAVKRRKAKSKAPAKKRASAKNASKEPEPAHA